MRVSKHVCCCVFVDVSILSFRLSLRLPGATVCFALRRRDALVFSILSSLCVSRHEHRCYHDWQLPRGAAAPAAREERVGFHSNRAWEAARSLDESILGVLRLRLLLRRYCGDCWILHLLLRAETDQPQTAEPQTGTAQDLAADLIGF